MNGWDIVVRPERALGVLFGLSGIVRAAAWWIDRDNAKREAYIEQQRHQFHRTPLGYSDEW